MTCPYIQEGTCNRGCRGFQCHHRDERRPPSPLMDPTAVRERLRLLERALVYSAHMQHATPKHMLPKGVALLDADGVIVMLPSGERVEAHDRAAGVRVVPSGPTLRCRGCDGTGDVTRADGEYLGRCVCEAGRRAPGVPACDGGQQENGNG